MTAPVDLGNLYGEQILADCLASMAAFGLATPGLASYIAGSAVPIMDCCIGLLWTRLDTQYPSNGDGSQFNATRANWSIPAWVFQIQVGVLWCHENIDSAGNMVDPATEQANAQRDGQYRAAIFDALGYRSPDSLRAICADTLSYRITPWTPIGPDGGCSGGALSVTVISAALAS